MNIENNLIILTDNEEVELMESVYEIDTGYKLANKLLNEHKNITAIIGVNDMTSVGIINAVKNRGLRIPEDIAICGFDNTYIAQDTYPNLTSVDHGISIRSRPVSPVR